MSQSSKDAAGRLGGRVAIVTGAAQGIGARYAQALAAEGAAVVCADVADAGAVVARIVEAGGKAVAVRADVTSAESAEAMARAAVEAFGRIDILVNNAGLFANLALKPFEQITSTEWDRVMAVNVRGPFECAKAVIPAMRKQQYGKIINIASGTVFKGAPMLLHYVSSKGAVVAMTRSMARELGDAGIRVNTLAPGLTASENTLANPAWQGTVSANNIASRAIKREVQPEDLCGTLVYLASEASDFVTGQVLVVDGGSVMH
ncbi:SDR family NAD(P)-dependent oxidoreductase [Noviherbaspirillum denitrificans]|uniref:Dehydrogenase n=1 Tax=Noviherbaspirillum denitrificans TaxID=1968433 RepID=A0A254THT5_9BURK|nr:glucose 1-dehydrogenase [Noviherbaspirillum denitrificans]OWW22075.1 dehydrogenase [Noviherbaspirillum denitrificans]